jgi:hypothetical protein
MNSDGTTDDPLLTEKRNRMESAKVKQLLLCVMGWISVMLITKSRLDIISRQRK